MKRRMIAAGAAATAVFVLVLTAVVTDWAPLAHLDHTVAATAARWGQDAPWWVPVWAAVSTVFAPWTFRAVAILALIDMFVVERSRRKRAAGGSASPRPTVPSPVLPAAITVIVGGLLPVAVKALVDRPRPPEALVAAAQSSFPSAHAFGAVVGVGAVLAVLRARDSASARRGWASAGILAILLVSTARVMLAVHYVSDVVAGAALGVVWLALAWLAFSPRHRTGLSAAACGPAR